MQQRQPAMPHSVQHGTMSMPSRGGSRGFQSFQPPASGAPLVSMERGGIDMDELRRREEQEVSETLRVARAKCKIPEDGSQASYKFDGWC